MVPRPGLLGTPSTPEGAIHSAGRLFLDVPAEDSPTSVVAEMLTSRTWKTKQVVLLPMVVLQLIEDPSASKNSGRRHSCGTHGACDDFVLMQQRTPLCDPQLYTLEHRVPI